MNVGHISPNFKGLIVLKDYGTAYNTDNITQITDETATVTISKGKITEKRVGIKTNYPSPVKVYQYDFNTIIDAYQKAAISPDTIVTVNKESEG